MINSIAFGVYILFGLSIILFSIRGKVDFSLMLLVILIPLQNVLERFHSFPLGKDFIDTGIILMLLVLVFRKTNVNKTGLTIDILKKLAFIMFFYTFFSLLIGSFNLKTPISFIPPDSRLQNWKNYAFFPTLYFVTVNSIHDTRQIKRIIFAMAISMIIMDYYTLNQIRWMPGLLSREKLQGTFVWTGVNAVAAFYAQYLFIFLGIASVYKRKFPKIFYWFLVIVGAYIILFLYSRGAYLAFMLGIIAFALVKKRILIIPLIVILLSWKTLMPQTVVERITHTQAEEQLDSSSQQRIDLWKECFEYFKSSPIVGIGFNTVSFLGLTGGFQDTHNIYVKFLVEQGIVGLFLLLWLFLLALKYSWNLFRKSNDDYLSGLGLGFYLCTLATILTNFFGDRWTYFQLGSYYWIALGLVTRGNLIIAIPKKANLKK